MGSRLRPLTLSAPKPMLPTAGVPFLTHLVARIREAGIHHIVLGTSYRAEVFQSYFGDGSAFGVEMEYVVETEPLGTGGGIRNVADRLRAETVLIFNGDVLSGVDLRALLATHADTDADVTLYLTKVEDPRAFGCVPTDAEGRVTAFLEKDPDPGTDQINAGTYVFRRALVDAIPPGRPVSVERETFPGLLAAGARVFGHVDSTYWRDLGRPADFVAGSADLVLGLAPSPALPGPTGPALVLAGARVDPTAHLSGGTTVGAGAVVWAGAVLDGSVLFDGATIGPGAVVRRSAVGFGAVVGAGAVLEDAVVGDRARIGARVELVGGARVWPDVVLADGAVRFSSDL
ncbi:MAG: GDP-mannose pyrophosphorylase [Pseudonocardiales bacterium]|nr:MAG: GDP-mannose pyrophosphorylase [Pseudonocardiales bacterium]